MALQGLFVSPEGDKWKNAYWRVNATGHVARPLVTCDVYRDKQTAENLGRCYQVPLGFHAIDPNKPTGPQVYAIVKAVKSHLVDAE